MTAGGSDQSNELSDIASRINKKRQEKKVSKPAPPPAILPSTPNIQDEPSVPVQAQYAADPYHPMDHSSVAKSQLFKEIVDRFLMGMTPKAISVWLLEEHNARIPEGTLYRYQKKFINPIYMLPDTHVTKLRSLLRKFEGHLSAMEGVKALMYAQETRVGEMIRYEHDRRNGVGSCDGIPPEPGYFYQRLRGEIEILYNMYRDHVNMEIALGRIKDTDGQKTEPPF